MQQVILRAEKIRKCFKKPSRLDVLKGINLEVHQGEAVAITGESGVGKSTLLHILGTLEGPSSGELTICCERVMSRIAPLLRNQHIGFIFQGYHLLDEYSALDNVLMPAKIARFPTGKKSKSYCKALALLERVGLKERAFFPAKLLSGGEKQRVAIARALCNDPDLILADEPSGNLDAAYSEEIHQLLLSMTKQSHVALVVVTHNEKLANMCDVKYELVDGKLLRMETP